MEILPMSRMNMSGNISSKCEDKTKNIQLKEERKNILRKNGQNLRTCRPISMV